MIFLCLPQRKIENIPMSMIWRSLIFQKTITEKIRLLKMWINKSKFNKSKLMLHGILFCRLAFKAYPMFMVSPYFNILNYGRSYILCIMWLNLFFEYLEYKYLKDYEWYDVICLCVGETNASAMECFYLHVKKLL